MDKLKELREKLAKLLKDGRGIIEKAEKDKRGLTSEEEDQWKRMNDDMNQIERDIRVEELQIENEARLKKSAADPIKSDPSKDPVNGRSQGSAQETKQKIEEARDLALQGWCRAVNGREVREDHIEAARKVNVNLHRPEFVINLFDTREYMNLKTEFRVLAVGTGNLGGFTVPQGFVSSLETALLAFGGVRQVAEIMRTTSGEDLPWPTMDDTGNSGELLAENAAVNLQDVAFGQIIFKAYKYSSKAIKVSVELLEDSAFNLASVLGTALGERIGRIQNTHFTTGDGSSKPKGIVVASSLGKTTASGTAITSDELIDLFHSVDPAYRVGASWMLHDGILQAIRKLKDSNNNYLLSGLAEGTPSRILGAPFTINQQMQATVATATKTILFGQMSKYKIRDVNQIRLLRLNELYAGNDQVGFLAFFRSDGNLLDAGVAPVKHMLQA